MDFYDKLARQLFEVARLGSKFKKLEEKCKKCGGKFLVAEQVAICFECAAVMCGSCAVEECVYC